MMALCAVWVSHSRPRKVPEEGFRKRSLATGERFLKGSWKRYSVPFPKVLRTFSWPVLNDDAINCTLGYVAFVDANRKLSLLKSQPRLKRTSFPKVKHHTTWRISSESTVRLLKASSLDLRLREIGHARTPALKEPLVQFYSSCHGGPVSVRLKSR